MSPGAPNEAVQRQLRALPKVSAVLEQADVLPLLAAHGAAAVTRAVRAVIEQRRAALLAGGGALLEVTGADLEAVLQAPGSLRRAINATGVLVHTNLGRSPLAREALLAVEQVAAGYSTLEYDLHAGRRGNRHAHASALLTELCGAEDAAVVNNCAGAVLLALSAVAHGQEVVVSRGELIEIGGGFRVPDVMAQSGARLVEVGTTNRTWAHDYERAIGEHTAALMKVHRSNFDLVGFTHEVEVEELAAVARQGGVPLLVDAGSGCLRALEGAPGERPVADLLAAGADLVMFSGDKLLGGPQAGIVVGRADLVEQVRRHPLMRALRPDKMALAALTATLELWRDRPEAVPLWRMANASVEALRARGQKLVEALERQAGLEVALVDTRAQFGGGTTPSAGRPSVALSVRSTSRSAAALEQGLREHSPPVIGRIDDGALLLDLRTVAPEEDEWVCSAVSGALEGSDD